MVKCHNKGSCIQGPVEKLSWLHTNVITKRRIYLIECYNDQSQFSFLCRYIWEIFNNHFRLLLQREAGYFDNDHVVRLSTLIYRNLFYCKSWTWKIMFFFQRIWLKCMNAAYLVCCSWISRNSNSQTLYSWQHSYCSFVQSWKGLEVKSYLTCLRSLKSTGFLYWVFKSPWNSISCLLHTVFCEIRLSCRGKFGSSLV